MGEGRKGAGKFGEAGEIRLRLRRWFRREGRDLPWRRTRDPYPILVSEFMLQQTTVAAVLPYFERWMRDFPTVTVLAGAGESAVLDHWQGLGYYSRARNLHRAAREIVFRHDGELPKDLQALRELPGVGAYTAAAVAAFAFDAAVPVLDANIIRVLARMEDWRKPIDIKAGRAFLEAASQRLLPARGGRIHTSALMELGALVCVAKSPRCGICPVQEFCRARAPEALPVKRARPPITKIRERRAFVRQGDKIWLEASPGPRWRGLWILPLAEGKTQAELHREVHPVTRYLITMSVVREARLGRSLRGFSPDDLPPMPSPHRRAVAAILGRGHTRSHVS